MQLKQFFLLFLISFWNAVPTLAQAEQPALSGLLDELQADLPSYEEFEYDSFADFLQDMLSPKAALLEAQAILSEAFSSARAWATWLYDFFFMEPQLREMKAILENYNLPTGGEAPFIPSQRAIETLGKEDFKVVTQGSIGYRDAYGAVWSLAEAGRSGETLDRTSKIDSIYEDTSPSHFTFCYGNSLVLEVPMRAVQKMAEHITCISENLSGPCADYVGSFLRGMHISFDRKEYSLDLFEYFSQAALIDDFAQFIDQIPDPSIQELSRRLREVARPMLTDFEMSLQVNIGDATNEIISSVHKQLKSFITSHFNVRVELISSKPYWKIPKVIVCIFAIYSQEHINFDQFLEIFAAFTFEKNSEEEATWSRYEYPYQSFYEKNVRWVSVNHVCHAEQY